MNSQTPLERPHQPLLCRGLEQALQAPPAGEENTRTSALLNALLEDALRERASDVHLDPAGDGFRIRFRIDGAMIDTLQLSPAEGQRLVRACKNLAALEPGVARVPGDGRAEFRVSDRPLGVRVAVTPTVSGEKLALRLLRAELTRLSLNQLGLSPSDYDLLRRAVQDARGMILLSGPTGSGKTTTLYALLHEMRHTSRSVVTIEDPVEYVVPGITQIQVNPKQGLTFAEGAKGLLRLDPDVILMGEMRDAASARVAIDVADTGLLYLSSLHARDAVATITALRNFGLQDFEIAASVDLIVAQRLVRRLCVKCRRAGSATTEEVQWLERLGQPVPAETWQAVGCPQCSMTGYYGRTGIFEVWRLNEEETDLVLQHADEHTLRRHLRRSGRASMLDDDLAKVAEGITTLAEMQAVGGLGFYAPSEPPRGTARPRRTATAARSRVRPGAG
ncbi:MAG: GspE/PulE family protein [Verrucomicrobia bacterium]|nr:GspE/PulE family protein [Verrucomicrobiota bacterium]